MKDLRSHLAMLEAEGLLLRFTRPVDPLTQASAIMDQLAERGQAGLFESTGHPLSLLFNSFGSKKMAALALGCPTDGLVTRFNEAMRNRIEPIRVDTAPVQEIVLEGDDVDLGILPIPIHSSKDVAPYLTAGMVLAHDPDTGSRNVSINRMILNGRSETGLRMMAPQQLGVIGQKFEERGEDFPVAVAIGVHPVDYLAAATSLKYGEDELALAGGLRREPVRLVPGVTVPIDVPADAEIVIEGRIERGSRVPDGPFGEFLRTYTMRPQVSNRFVVTAITHRRDALYQTMAAASPEDVQLLGLSRAALVEEALDLAGFDVVSFALNPTIMSGVLSIRQRYDGEAKAAAMLALGVYRWLKYCIVVDDDIDVDDHQMVMWAITTRLNATSGISSIAGTSNFPGDPFGAYSAKLVIDATHPMGERPEFERSVPPGSGVVRLEDFL